MNGEQCYSVGGAQALDEVRFIPLSRPRSRHQLENPTPPNPNYCVSCPH